MHACTVTCKKQLLLWKQRQLSTGKRTHRMDGRSPPDCHVYRRLLPLGRPVQLLCGRNSSQHRRHQILGGCLWSFFASLRAAFRHADRSAAASGEGNRHVRILQETHQPCFLAFPDLVGDIQPISVDHRHTGPSAGNHSRLLPLLRRRGYTPVAGSINGIHRTDAFQLLAA